MIGGSSIRRVAMLGALCLLAAWPAAGEEIVVYESLSEIAIGRVFLSHRERSMLDEGRGSDPLVQPVPTKRVVAERQRTSKREPAGYIVSSTGESRVWSDGGFVSKQPAARMRFPGDVVVKRSEPRDTETRRTVGEREAESTDEGS